MDTIKFPANFKYKKWLIYPNQSELLVCSLEIFLPKIAAFRTQTDNFP